MSIDCRFYEVLDAQPVCRVVAAITALPLTECHVNDSACKFCLGCGVTPQTPNVVTASMSISAARRTGGPSANEAMHARMKPFLRQLAPAPQPLTMWQRATSAAGVMAGTAWNAATTGQVFVSNEIRRERFAICEACEHFSAGNCALCGCSCNVQNSLSNKLAHADSECPIKKWGKAKPESIAPRSRVLPYRAVEEPPVVYVPGVPIDVHFDHGLGDCCQFALLAQLYIRRGMQVRISGSEDKAAVYKLAGLPSVERSVARHHKWPHTAMFNQPDTVRDGHGNKTYGNLNAAPLPVIGDVDELWEELATIRLNGEAIYEPGFEAEAARFLADLPRPIVLLHSVGLHSSGLKSIPDDTTAALYRELLNGMPGSLVLLDWRHVVPKMDHPRIKHLYDDWGHISLTELWHLMKQADMMIGVDSGPLHFAAFADLPTLGVFHGYHPSSVTLPRPDVLNMAPDRYHAVNVAKRKRWGIVEYPGDMPTAKDIATHALRMLATMKDGTRIDVRQVINTAWGE